MTRVPATAAPPPPDAVTWQPDQWVVTDDGSGPSFFKAITAGWDEEDDLYKVRVFDRKDAAVDWVYERAEVYREEPRYDEEEEEEYPEEDGWDDPDVDDDADDAA